MEQILIRNLPEGTKARLRHRADEHSRSVEAEARAILSEGLAADAPTLVEAVQRAEADFCRQKHVRDWSLFADAVELRSQTRINQGWAPRSG